MDRSWLAPAPFAQQSSAEPSLVRALGDRVQAYGHASLATDTGAQSTT